MPQFDVTRSPTDRREATIIALDLFRVWWTRYAAGRQVFVDFPGTMETLRAANGWMALIQRDPFSAADQLNRIITGHPLY